MMLSDIMPQGDLPQITSSLKSTTGFYIQLLCYAIASICGLVAGLRIYSLWNIHGRHHVHIDAQVIAWVSAAMFLIVAMAFVNNVLL